MHDDDIHIKLHDYFDGLLSPEEEGDFQTLLMDNRSLAIELGKLKDLKRRLKNMPLSFEPPGRIIDNITEKLLTLECKNSQKLRRKEPQKIKPKLKPTKKKSGSKVLVSVILILIIVVLGGAGGYYFYNMNKSTTPWRIVTLSGEVKIGSSGQSGNQISENQIFQLSDEGESDIYLGDEGVLKIIGKSEFEILSASNVSNTIRFNYGLLEYIPKPNSIELETVLNDFKVKSNNAKFRISTDELGDYTAEVLNNFVVIEFREKHYRFAHDHRVKIVADQIIRTPYFINTNSNFIKLLQDFDYNKEPKLLKNIISRAEKVDALSLHFLLSQVKPADRELIISKLEELVPLPYGVAESEILILNQEMLNKWWDKIYSEIF